jgi:hypothetical protein
MHYKTSQILQEDPISDKDVRGRRGNDSIVVSWTVASACLKEEQSYAAMKVLK